MKFQLVIVAFFAVSAWGGEPVQLSLPDAVSLALKQNHALKIARLKITEHEQKKAAAKSSYFPEIKNHSSVLRTTSEQNIEIPAGAFGTIAGGGLVPSHDILINQGAKTFVTSGTTLLQPLTQLIRIHQANRIAASEVSTSHTELKRAENAVALQVHTLYYGILITRLQLQAAELESAYAARRLRESQDDVQNGVALRNAEIEGRAGLLEGKQAELSARLRLADLTTELNEVLGLDLDTALDLSPLGPVSMDERTKEDYLRTAWAESPEIKTAAETLAQSEASVVAAKSAYIPDVTVFARHSYQNGVPFLIHNFGTFGVNLSYDIFDFGKRRAEVREREARRAQAQENLERTKRLVSAEIERGYNKAERTKQMLHVSAEVVALRQENERITVNQMTHGAVLASSAEHASVALLKARADLLQAQLSHLLATAELERSTGRTPGF